MILATSQGSALYPLTREEGEEGATDADATGAAGAGANGAEDAEALGRAQLPVANRPLLWFQLDMVSKAGFPHVLVVTRDSMRRGVTRIIDEWRVARGGAPALAAANVTVTPAPASLDLAAPATPTAAQLSASPSLASLSAPTLIDVELACIETYRGAADALRQVAERITTDFFCLSGDLVSNVQVSARDPWGCNRAVSDAFCNHAHDSCCHVHCD